MRHSAAWLLLATVIACVAIPRGAASAQADDGAAPDADSPEADAEEPGTRGSDADEEDAQDAPAAPSLTPPRLLDAPPVSLPEDAEPLPDNSSVELTVLIAVDGSVSEVSIATPLRDDVDALVLEAAQGMTFEPARRDGVAIPARVRFRYRITPPPEPEPPAEEDVGEEDGSEEDDSEDAPAEEPAEPDLTAFETDDADELGVTAEVIRPEPGAATRITLEAEELTTVPGTFGEPLRVVATLPGVVRSPFGLGFFLVRGANFQNTGFFVDGFQVPLLYHLAAGPAVISSRFVSRLNFYPGGYPAAYGRLSAGIVSLETSAPRSDSIRGEVAVDLFRAEALLTVPFDEGRGTVAGAFRRSYYELILPLVLDGLHVEYTDYQLRGDYRVDDHLSLSLFFFGSDDAIDQTGTFGGGTASEGTRNAFSQDFQRLIARIDMRLPERVHLRVSGMMGRDGTTFTNASPGTDGLRFALENIYLALRVDTQIPWNDELQTNFGLDINTIVFNVNASAFVPTGLGEYPRPAFTPQAADVNQVSIRATSALYLEQIFRAGPVELSVAGRFDYMRYGDVSEVFPDPRGVARWQVVPELLLKLATGLFTQPPNAFQTGRIAGTRDLPPQRSWQSSFGAELTLPEHVEVQSTVYYSQMFDITRQTNRVVTTDDGPQRQFFVADQQGRAYGLEVLIRRRIEQGFYGWLSYTLSRSERLRGDGTWQAFQFDQTHTLNLAASYAFDGWRFGVAFQLSTGRPTNTLVSTTYDADQDAIDPRFLPRGERLAPFHRLDVRIDRDFDLGPVRGSIYLDIQNIYNAPNNEGILFSYDYSQTAPVPGLPILPTIGIRASLQ